MLYKTYNWFISELPMCDFTDSIVSFGVSNFNNCNTFAIVPKSRSTFCRCVTCFL